jgi:hypothetical protein
MTLWRAGDRVLEYFLLTLLPQVHGLHQVLLISNNMGYFKIVPYVRRDLLSTLVDKGPKSEVKRLLDNGADVNSKDWNGRSPLSHATEYRQFHISQLLLERGSIVDTRDLAGRTPLSFAAESDCRAVLENGSRWRMVVAGEWQALESGSHWRMIVAGEWQALESGSHWRLVVAGEWQALKSGSRWRIAGAGEL